MVASAPSTTSIFIRKMKNRMMQVAHPKKPQKILRAKASRKVSRTRAAVAVVELLAIDGPDENFLQRAAGARQRFDLTFFRAQQVDGAVGRFAIGEVHLDLPVFGGEGGRGE